MSEEIDLYNNGSDDEGEEITAQKVKPIEFIAKCNFFNFSISPFAANCFLVVVGEFAKYVVE